MPNVAFFCPPKNGGVNPRYELVIMVIRRKSPVIDKAHILDEIRRTAKANGGAPLGRARFEDETGIRAADWYGKHWRSWGEAVTRRVTSRTSCRPHFRKIICSRS
jgi:hypothetical protein